MDGLKRFGYRVLCGFFLGLSIFAPGFSGSVVAIVMGIYYDLIKIVSNPFKDFKKNVKMLFPLGVGAVVSLVLFLLLFKVLFETHLVATYLLFVGLIIGNIPAILDEIKKSGFKKRYLWGMVSAFILALVVSYFGEEKGTADSISGNMLLWISSGFLGGASALVPGMSVSMILIILGVYGQLIFMAEGMLHGIFTYWLVAGVFGVSAIVGLALTARGIKKVFDKFPGFANSTVMGFMCGSLLGIFVQTVKMGIGMPWAEWGVGAVMLLVGLGISVGFVVMSKKIEFNS